MPAGQAPNVASQTVGRLPQTTQGLPGGGPFIRYAEEAVALAYSTAGLVFSATAAPVSNLPLTAVPGFLRALIVTVQATGGTGATASVTGTADAPWNVISQLTLRDASGQPIYPAIDGFGLFLINLYSGQVGQGGDQDPRGLSSFSAIQSTSGSGAGNFLFKLWVPLEYNSSGYCSLPADNSAELPKLLIQFATSATVYTTAPATLPTITLTVEEAYWAVPNNMPDAAPFDVGASAQWLLTTSGQNPPSNAYMRVLDQGVGQFVHTKIHVYRDSTGARGNGTVDHFPASPEQWIDQFQYRLELFNTRTDLIGLMFGRGLGIGAASTASQTTQTRPLDVVVYSWRDAVQRQVSLADDAEGVLVTTGSTKYELAGTWATLGSNSPPSLTTYTGMIFPGESGYPFGSQSA